MQRWDLLAISAPQGTRDPVVVAQDDGDVAMRKCFAERAPSAPLFAAVRKQAQELVDRFK